jgi:colanic acid/amylovoran biosynthesis glycosyltransferase
MILQISNIASKITGSIAYQESLSIQLEKLGIKSVSVSGVKNIYLRFIHIFITLIRYTGSVKIVLIHSFSTKAYWITVLASFYSILFRKKFICVLHGGDYPNRIRKSYTLTKFIVNRAYMVISPSIYLKYHFDKLGVNTVFIPNAVELDVFPFKERFDFCPKIIWVRALKNIYNPAMAIKMVNNLKKMGWEPKLLMVGPFIDDSFETCKKLITSLNLSENVEFTGRISHKDWAKKSIDYDIFINTTNIDNMPLSVLQAMSLGLPVISTNAGGMEFLIEDGINGFKVNVDSDLEMANKIDFLLRNQHLLQSVTEKAMEELKLYSWETVLPRWKEILS